MRFGDLKYVHRCHRLPRQLLIRQPRRPIRRIAQPAALVFLIGLEVPLEPFATLEYPARALLGERARVC